MSSSLKEFENMSVDGTYKKMISLLSKNCRGFVFLVILN